MLRAGSLRLICQDFRLTRKGEGPRRDAKETCFCLVIFSPRKLPGVAPNICQDAPAPTSQGARRGQVASTASPAEEACCGECCPEQREARGLRNITHQRERRVECAD